MSNISTLQEFLDLQSKSPDFLRYVFGLVMTFEKSEKRIFPLTNGRTTAALTLDEDLSILFESLPPFDLEPSPTEANLQPAERTQEFLTPKIHA